MDSSNASPHAGRTAPVVAVAITDKLNDKVIALIIVKTGQNDVFSAFDITKELRTDNPRMSVPHDEVKEMVLEEFNNTFCDDYKRTLTELTVGYSFVYHPDTVDALTHPLAVQTASPRGGPSSPPAIPTSPVGTDTDLTVEKRLNIPKPMLDTLGLVAGKIVRIDTDNGVMSITEATSSPYETLNVNADGRLRLNARTLTKAFGRLPDKYDIAVSSDDMTITITPK